MPKNNTEDDDEEKEIQETHNKCGGILETIAYITIPISSYVSSTHILKQCKKCKTVFHTSR